MANPDGKFAGLGKEMYNCSDCRLYTDGPIKEDELIWGPFLNGNFLNIQGTNIPLSSDFIPCNKHLQKIEEINERED